MRCCAIKCQTEWTKFRPKKIWVISVVSGVDRGNFTEDMGPIRPFTSLSGISEGWKRGNGLLGRNLSVSQERLNLLVGCE